MKFYVVIDTNVVISALFKPDSLPGKIINYALTGKIIPLLHEKIWTEYKDVINRPKFKFSQEQIERVLRGIKDNGKFIDAKNFEEELPDPKDKIFYCVLMTAREDVDAYLVTGNLKHFPKKIFIVTPRELLDILEQEELNDNSRNAT